jgi:hypothetical protein
MVWKIEYELTFWNTINIEAASEEEARKKWEALAEGELNALDGEEDGYKICSVEPTEEPADE